MLILCLVGGFFWRRCGGRLSVDLGRMDCSRYPEVSLELDEPVDKENSLLLLSITVRSSNGLCLRASAIAVKGKRSATSF